ncbi:hypothetical protein BDV97DRAFT_339784 [Delphinella strobiligena]|nr:hypothetical protein BDV97DRAFT_339784 [Delphinella strobiligena]
MDSKMRNHNHDLGVGLVALAWSLFITASCVVTLRIYPRLGHSRQPLAKSDWPMICSWISEIFHCIFITIAQHWGLGRHIDTLTSNQMVHAIHYLVVSESFSIMTSYFGRMSFSVFLLGIFGVVAQPQRIALFLIIILDTIVNIIVMVQIYAQCGTAIGAVWNPAAYPSAICDSPNVEKNLGYVQASINSACDLVLTILPITIIWSLHMVLGTKIAIGALLTLSGFALFASIAKGVEISQLANGADPTYHFAILQFTVVVENDVVMMAASLPMLRPLWRKNSMT